MSTMREHMAAFHKSAAQHHLDASKQHAMLAECFGKLNGDDADTFRKIADGHSALADSHATASEQHVQGCKDCEKREYAAGAGDDLTKMVPDRISSVMTSDFVRAVPRFGAPTVADADVSRVPEQFRKLVSRMDDDD